MSGSSSSWKQAEAEFHFATAWRRAGNLVRAEAGFRRAIGLEPRYVPPYIELTELLESCDRYDDALALYATAEQMSPLDGGLRSRRERLEGRLAGAPSTPIDDRVTHTATAAPHVLFYTDAPGIYGAEQINHALMLGLQAAGFRVTCAQARANHRLVHERVQAGIPHVWLEHEHVYDTTTPARSLYDPAESAEVIRTTSPDLVLFGDGCPVSSVMPKYAAFSAGIPYCVIVHCVDASWADQFSGHLPSLAKCYENAAEVIAVSTQNLELLRRRFGLSADKGRVIFNGRPAAFFESRNPQSRADVRRAFAIPDAATAFLTVARLDWVKGHVHLLEAFARLADNPAMSSVCLLWVGAGSLDAKLRARVVTRGLSDRIRFMGERSDIPAMLDAADGFLLPSHFEGMPLSIMEAMAKGLPVAASAVSGIPEELDDAGVLLPNPEIDAPGTVDALADVLHRWTTEPLQRLRVGEAGRRRAMTWFREERMIADYCSLVSQALDKPVASGLRPVEEPA